MSDNSVAILDDSQWKEFIKKIEKNIKKPDKILSAAYGTRGYKDIINHFNQEEGPDGKWKEHSAATIQKRGPNARILQDTGNLRNSITPSNYKSIQGGIKVFAAASYSGIHDRGTQRIPKRSFMWLSRRALADMAQIVLKLVTK